MNDESESSVYLIEIGILTINDNCTLEGDNQNDEEIHTDGKIIISGKRNRDTMLDDGADDIPDSFKKYDQRLAQQPDH